MQEPRPPDEPTTPQGALNAAELAEVLAELRTRLSAATILDIARLRDCDDLLLFCETPEGKHALQIAPGGPRARICITSQRFRREEFATGPLVDRLRSRLAGAQLRDIRQREGERQCEFAFEKEGCGVQLAVELFGPRGLWCVIDGENNIEEMSRLPNSKHRTLAPGARYEPPAPRGVAPTTASRFAAPRNENVDRHFSTQDRGAAHEKAIQQLTVILDRAMRKAQQRVAGLQRQSEQVDRAPEMRRDADMILAYAFQIERGAEELLVPHPDLPGESLRIPLDPAKPAPTQADALYKKARKLELSVENTQRSLAESSTTLATLEQLARALTQAATPDAITPVEAGLGKLGLIKPPAAKPKQQPKSVRASENFRRFTSVEGQQILVGRTNQQNDRLTVRVARGNDLWFHVGQGYAGSHVVIRIPKGKTASLETMLDAGTLAVHFSKARGAGRCDVIYTQAKHVRKPKGLPAGRVVPSQTKTLTVIADDDRLRRLLDGAT